MKSGYQALSWKRKAHHSLQFHACCSPCCPQESGKRDRTLTQSTFGHYDSLSYSLANNLRQAKEAHLEKSPSLWAQQQEISAVRGYLHPTIPPEVSPEAAKSEGFSLPTAACSHRLLWQFSHSLSCPNLSGWGGVKGTGWPPHLPGAFQCLTPELLSCCALTVLTECFHFSRVSGQLFTFTTDCADRSSSPKLVFLKVHLS